MSSSPLYTTRLQAGLGLISETLTLLELWSPGITARQLYRAVLTSGRFPHLSARRLRNIVIECFAPRYLVSGGAPARHLKQLRARLPIASLSQLMFLYTSRANPILGDFVRQVYWMHYVAGDTEISNEAARAFVQCASDDGKTARRWSENTVRRVAAYLTGCCADFGLLEGGLRSRRRILPFRITPTVAAYLAHQLHFSGVGDNALLNHEDWRLFGLAPEDVLEELKRISRMGMLIVQVGGDAIRISWRLASMEALCDAITQG